MLLGIGFAWEKFKGVIVYTKDFVKKAKNIDGDAAASMSMRWARPVFFILMTAMLLVGWWDAAKIGIYFEAMSKAPDWLTNIFTILILGLAVEKGISRPIGETVTAVKTIQAKAATTTDESEIG